MAEDTDTLIEAIRIGTAMMASKYNISPPDVAAWVARRPVRAMLNVEIHYTHGPSTVTIDRGGSTVVLSPGATLTYARTLPECYEFMCVNAMAYMLTANTDGIYGFDAKVTVVPIPEGFAPVSTQRGFELSLSKGDVALLLVIHYAAAVDVSTAVSGVAVGYGMPSWVGVNLALPA